MNYYAVFVITAVGATVGSEVLFGEIVSAQYVNNQMVVELRDHAAVRIPEPTADPDSIRISPDKRRLAYGLRFVQGSDPLGPYMLRTWFDRPEGLLNTIAIPTSARFIEHIQWLGDQVILISGDGHGSLVDVERGTTIRRLWGNRLGAEVFFAAPNQTMIAFAKGTGRVPPKYVSDVAAVVMIESTTSSGANNISINYDSVDVYPPEDDSTKGTPAPLPERRHRFLSPFLWFSDSSRLVFAEEQDGATWIVLVTLNVKGSTLTADHDRFQVESIPAGMDDFDWAIPDIEIAAQVQGKMLLINLPRRSVTEAQLKQ